MERSVDHIHQHVFFCYNEDVSMMDQSQALCIYGVSVTLSVQLIGQYGSEDDIPLNEFDPVEYQRSRMRTL